jgi:hypothetical protein
MSNAILNQLLYKHAFDGSPLHVDMPAYHVPFDDQQRTGTESGVVRAAEGAARSSQDGYVLRRDGRRYLHRRRRATPSSSQRTPGASTASRWPALRQMGPSGTRLESTGLCVH